MNEERKKILKMIEEGLISSEEAEDLLDSLDKAENASQEAASLTTQVDWDKQSEQKQQSTRTGKRASIVGYIEEAFQKIKHADLDFNFGSYFDVSHIFHQQADPFSKMDVDVSNGSVTIIPWSEKDVRIACEAKVYQADNQDDARKRFLNESELQTENGILKFYLPSKQMKTDIQFYIPAQSYERASIRLFNGSIHIKDVKVDQLKVKTTNGSVQLDDTEGTSGELETTSGSIKIFGGKWETIDAETINGSIKLVGSFEKANAQTVSGSIHCDLEDRSAKVGFFQTTTGSVRLTIPTVVNISGQFKTNIGAIHCDLKDFHVVEEKKDLLQRLLRLQTKQNMTEYVHIEAEAKTGSIWIREKG